MGIFKNILIVLENEFPNQHHLDYNKLFHEFYNWLNDSEINEIFVPSNRIGIYLDLCNDEPISIDNVCEYWCQHIKSRNPSYKKEKIRLLERDGSDCFLCVLPLNDDITVDHLQPLSAGGKNTLSNMVLMHEHCNQELKNMLLIDKLKIIIKNHTNS